jgi:hypothetical protein
MATKEGQNWYQSIYYDVLLSCRQMSFILPQGTPSREEHTRFSLQRRCILKCPFFLPRGEKLVW